MQSKCNAIFIYHYYYVLHRHHHHHHHHHHQHRHHYLCIITSTIYPIPLPPASGDWYATAYLRPKQLAVMETEVLVEETKEAQVLFQYFEGDKGVKLSVCCNGDQACTFKSPATGQRQWMTQSAHCPKGTKKVELG